MDNNTDLKNIDDYIAKLKEYFDEDEYELAFEKIKECGKSLIILQKGKFFRKK